MWVSCDAVQCDGCSCYTHTHTDKAGSSSQKLLKHIQCLWLTHLMARKQTWDAEIGWTLFWKASFFYKLSLLLHCKNRLFAWLNGWSPLKIESQTNIEQLLQKPPALPWKLFNQIIFLMTTNDNLILICIDNLKRLRLQGRSSQSLEFVEIIMTCIFYKSWTQIQMAQAFSLFWCGSL